MSATCIEARSRRPIIWSICSWPTDNRVRDAYPPITSLEMPGQADMTEHASCAVRDLHSTTTQMECMFSRAQPKGGHSIYLHPQSYGYTTVENASLYLA